MSWLSFVLRSIRLRAFSSVITILMVGGSVALLLVLLSMRASAHSSFRRGTGNMHLLVSADSSPLVSVLNGIFYANPPANPLSWSKFNELTSSFPWEWAIPTQLGDSCRGVPVLSTTADFFAKFQPVAGEPWRFAVGRPFEADFEVVAGAGAARELGIAEGDQLALTHGAWAGPGGHEHADHLFKVVGILEPTASSHDRALFINLESSWIIHAEDRREAAAGAAPAQVETHAEHNDDADHDHHDHAEHDHAHHDHAHVDADDLTDEDRKVTGVLLRLPTRPGRDATAAMQSQFDRLRRDTTLTVAMPADQVDKLFRIIGDIDSLFIAMGIAILVSSAAAIMLALYNSMDLRRRQVAILRVLGASRLEVFAVVLAESALLGALGAASGMAVAHFASMLAAETLRQKVGLVIEPSIDVPTLAVVALGTVALSAIAGVVPAMRAYRTSVADHLRPLG